MPTSLAIYPARYCYVLWESTRILEARELIKLEAILEGKDDAGNNVAYDLNSIYLDGATFNITPVISTTGGIHTVQFTPTNGTGDMLIFARGRWWKFISGETPPLTISLTDTIYLNWWVGDVDNSLDSSLVDAAGNPTAEMGQLLLGITTTNALISGLAYTPIEQNLYPAPVFSFVPNAEGTAPILAKTNSSTNVNANVKLQALGSPTTAGPVYLTYPDGSNIGFPGVACASNDPRLGATAIATPGTVVDASLKPTELINWEYEPVPSFGTGYYGEDVANTAGGINANKIVYTAGMPSWIPKKPTTVDVVLSNHIGSELGSADSHPLMVHSDTATFEVQHGVSDTASGDAFLVASYSGGGTRLAALTHTGDIYSAIAATVTPVVPRSGPYTGTSVSSIITPGTLASSATSVGNLSALAGLVSAHINQNIDSNPHGTNLSSMGGVFNFATNGYMSIPCGVNNFVLQWGVGSAPSSGNIETTVFFSSKLSHSMS